MQSPEPGARVSILAPVGRDAALLEEFLERDGISCVCVENFGGLLQSFSEEVSGALISEEALANVDIRPLVQWIAQQPPWSDLPILLLGSADGDLTGRLVNRLGEFANVNILERPVRVPTLLSAVRTALRARRRQLQVRSYLEERESRERQMLETQKLESLGVLAGGVAHDFNNLLTGILGNSSLALDNVPEGSPLKALLESVIDAAERAANLTRQLLAYSGRGQFLVKSLDLSDEVRAITMLVNTSIPKGVRVIFDLAPRLPLVQADPGQLQQVIMNLVINGAESIPEGKGGAVRVRTYSETLGVGAVPHLVSGSTQAGIYTVLEVEDTGSGMSPETLARIFDPFFTTKFTGRGLGLAAVQGIVRAHHGALAVRSTVGRGTAFRVLLPAGGGPTFSHTLDGAVATLPIRDRDPG